MYELMEPPRDGVGFVVTVMSLSNSPLENVIGAYLEYEGKVIGMGYLPGEGWVDLELPEITPTEMNYDEDKSEELVDTLADSISDAWEHDGRSIQMLPLESQGLAPAGWQFKVCVRHRPLSSGDYRQLLSWPQIRVAQPVMENSQGEIVGIVVGERRIDADRESLVFAWFCDAVGTWRILDTARKGVMRSEDIHHMIDEIEKVVDYEYDGAVRVSDGSDF